MKHKLTWLLAAVLLAVCIVSQGRVFERSGALSDSTRTLLAAGGTLAYETSVTVNGGKGNLAVVGFDKNIRAIIRELGRILGTKDMNFSGGTMGFVVAKSGGIIVRITAVQFGDSSRTLVLKLQQSEADYELSQKHPTEHTLKNIPQFPGSETVFSATDDKSGASVAVAQTPADASNVRSFYSSQLSSSGWSPALPGQNQLRDAPGLLVFNKGREICCLLVDSSLSQGKNRITLLHKQRGIE